MKNKENLDTIVAPITTSAGSSVAMIRISGKEAIPIADSLFSEKQLQNQKGGKFFYGTLKNYRGEVVDKVILLLYKAPHSFSGEDSVEISLHANPIIVENALKVFLNAGCRMAQPGEFSQRAYMNGKIDLLQAEAIANLISAKSEAAVKNALTQVQGKYSSEITNIKKNLIEITSLIELDIDFSDQELDIVSPDLITKKVDDVLEKVDHFLSSYNKGRVLTEGIKVLITGIPNVGKSSLMNAILDNNRVIVSSTPGTTRDIVYEDIYIDQIQVRLIDSAGIHLTENAVESEGIEKARGYFDLADIIVFVTDISKELSKEDTNLLELILQFYKNKIVIAANKMDLGENSETKNFLMTANIPVFKISAMKGDGIDEFKHSLPKIILDQNESIAEETFIVNQRQIELLKKTKESLIAARSGLINETGNEFIAVDMRESIQFLSEITGEITTDDILNTIFAGFCIGK